MNVNEKAEMIVCCSFIYDKRNNVASTGTALEPTTLTTVDEYSKTSLIRAAWDQGVSVTENMPVTEKYVYCVESCTIKSKK